MSDGGYGPSGPRSGFWRRFAAALVDGLIVSLALSIVGAAVGTGSGVDVTSTDGELSVNVDAVAQGLSLLVGMLYFGYLEGGPSGQTVGKRLFAIRVIRFDTGGPLGWPSAVLRFLSSWLSGIVFALGYLWMLWDREKQTWHDKMSGVVVVPADVYPPPSGSFGRPPR